jgi:tRNA-splicing ligase RtcB
MEKQRYIFAEVLEDTALEQFDSAMTQPFVMAGALMPDAHTGYALPIGAVIATNSVLVPAWVGYDIGCGVCAVRTTFSATDIISNGTQIFEAIYSAIPTGKGAQNSEPSEWPQFEQMCLTQEFKRIFRERKGLHQLGSLGGGNHFIEIGYDNKTYEVYIIIHSGSRGIGHTVATHHMTLAADMHTGIKKPLEGHYGFDIKSNEGAAYFLDQTACEVFALENRRQMMYRVITCIQKFCTGKGLWTDFINRNHNHVEKNGATGWWIHRKGATQANKGYGGVIPGNMRDGSFIVEGLGNPDSLWSSSHGAGRVMGREEAKRGKRDKVTGQQLTEPLSMTEFERSMGGIVARVTPGTIDESPMAYKDIHSVMRQQSKLVAIRAHIIPLINVKG